MPALRLRLSDGAIVADDVDLGELYEQLWALAGERRGAVTAAAKLRRPRLPHDRHGVLVEELDDLESQAVRAAISRLPSSQPNGLR